ncbi:copper-binding protein [Phenylobacterium hankyongense]|uniref:Copper-binding protein n=1 Tax=Phenylobacterium hankyongense TaxID=1813876 RepID=A0A328B004_9CAUL|nr:copper-binding protein [Phenylobacterium hankyongense]RAK60207.1 copper-binding protein [Phenylobacterium hankyongense]
MKRLVLTLAALTLAGGLAACGKKEPVAATEPGAEPATAAVATPAPAAPAASKGGDMAAMGMAGDAKMAKGTGKVTAVDAEAGTITLDHGPIPEAGWPAMTMVFKAGPPVTSAVKVGDTVAFDVKLQGGAGEVTAVQKQ